jgi:hypothetical protein
MGDYQSRKSYIVLNDKGTKTEVNGYVVQKVEKQSKATLTRPLGGKTELTKTEDFNRLTGGTVKYMCESYIELFTITRGESPEDEADEFANGPIAWSSGDSLLEVVEPDFLKEGRKKVLTYSEEDNKYQTSGEINQKGTNLLFIDEAKKKALLKLPWVIREEGPENGLRYLPVTNWDKLVAIVSDSSNTPIHNVNAAWDFEKDGTAIDNVTHLTDTFENNARIRRGGKQRRKTIKNRKN